MRPIVVHISGSAASGKTTLARILAARSRGRRPHYLRLEGHDLSAPAFKLAVPMAEASSSARLILSAERVFEQVSEELGRIAAEEAGALILAESDGLPWLRHAYPYDVKVFIMRSPSRLEEVFRSPQEVAATMDRAMDDTAVFASELFGLAAEPLGAGSLPDADPKRRPRAAPSGQSLEEFLRSSIGMEIAARLQLQPGYHALLDSDVVLVNEALSEDASTLAGCVARIEALLAKVRRGGRAAWLAVCDPLDHEDPLGQKSLERIEALIHTANQGTA